MRTTKTTTTTLGGDNNNNKLYNNDVHSGPGPDNDCNYNDDVPPSGGGGGVMQHDNRLFDFVDNNCYHDNYNLVHDRNNNNDNENGFPNRNRNDKPNYHERQQEQQQQQLLIPPPSSWFYDDPLQSDGRFTTMRLQQQQQQRNNHHQSRQEGRSCRSRRPSARRRRMQERQQEEVEDDHGAFNNETLVYNRSYCDETECPNAEEEVDDNVVDDDDDVCGVGDDEDDDEEEELRSCDSSTIRTRCSSISTTVGIEQYQSQQQYYQQLHQQQQEQHNQQQHQVMADEFSMLRNGILSNRSQATALLDSVGAPFPSPSWKEISFELVPGAARELLSSTLRRMCHTARWTYARSRWHRKYSDLGNNTGGHYNLRRIDLELENGHPTGCVGEEQEEAAPFLADLPPFSSLSWVERQLVREWRTYVPDHETMLGADAGDSNRNTGSDGSINTSCTAEDVDFDRARILAPAPLPRPTWQKAEVCYACNKTFGPTRLRHHCRLCGRSFCQSHSSYSHPLPHLGYDPDVPERVCDPCRGGLLDRNLAERVAWRLARCRDLHRGQLSPYFETGVDTIEEVVMRITQAALAMAKSVPLGAQATVAVETVDVLRRHGLNGIYTIMLRQEFLAAADLLRKALGINRTAWPLSVHELSAAIFYALAQYRALRGMNPDRENRIHALVSTATTTTTTPHVQPVKEVRCSGGGEATRELQYNSTIGRQGTELSPAVGETGGGQEQLEPVCKAVPSTILSSLILYAPLALSFIYAEKEVDMQLLAAQQGWRLLYAHLEQDEHSYRGGDLGLMGGDTVVVHDRPASAVFVHEEQKIACIAVRGTATIHDVITDIRQVPVPFPETDNSAHARRDNGAADGEGWTTVGRGQGIALCGMANAAANLYREHIDSLLVLAGRGYRIRMTGHSLGGAVATLLGVLVDRDLKNVLGDREQLDGERSNLRVYAYGTPSCVDASLSEFVDSFVTTVVLHDDVVPRLTPTSCRGLLKHLLHIRETWVKEHLTDDLMAITERAKHGWAPRWRGSFTLTTSPSSFKRYCRQQIQYGKQQFMSVKGRLIGDEATASSSLVTSVRQKRMETETATFTAVTGQAPDGLERKKGNQAEAVRSSVESSADASLCSTSRVDDTEGQPRSLLDYLGGVKDSQAYVIDGEEFYDMDANLVVDDDEQSCSSSDHFDDALSQSSVSERISGRGVDVSMPALEEEEVGGGAFEAEEVDHDSPGVVVLQETPLPQMFIPGKIVHIYAHRGVYKAAYVPRAFRELRRISLAGNSLADHKCKAYYEALVEVRTVRNAQESPPRWTAFDEDDTCSCCASRFTWASTSDSEAQEARDKHNCRSCGTLVCGPCSDNRVPIPSIGLLAPSRVCDRCFYDMGGILTGGRNSELAGSFHANDSDEQRRLASEVARVANEDLGVDDDDRLHGHHRRAHHRADHDDDIVDRPERQRERRSAIVDELASRVQAAPLACS